MAGLGFKDFAGGDELFASQIDGYLMQQSVMKFADDVARGDALLGYLAEGMITWLDDTNQVQVYQNDKWRTIAGAMPYWEMDRSTAQSVANNTTTTLTGFTTTTARNNTEALSYSNGVWTVATGESGIYSVAVFGEFAANTAGRRRLVITRNSSGLAGINISAPSAGAATMSASLNVYLASGDTISTSVFQTSGAALDFTGAKVMISKVSI